MPIFFDAAELTDISQQIVADTQQVNSKALWGPIKARLLPKPKQRLSVLFADNIRSLSQLEYAQLRFFMETICADESLKAQMMDMTGFKERDLILARDYFEKYRMQAMFGKLIEIALKTSSDNRVSRQIGGILEFLYQTDSIGGQVVSPSLKLKLTGEIKIAVKAVWLDLAQKCSTNPQKCITEDSIPYLDINENNVFDVVDIKIALADIDRVNAPMSQGSH